MLKQGRCNDDGYSLLEVMTVLVLVGLVVGLAFGAYYFIVKGHTRGREQVLLQQEARAVLAFLEKELTYSQRLALYSSSETPPAFEGQFRDISSDGNAVLVNGQPILSADGMEYKLLFHRLEESSTLLNIEVTLKSRTTQQTTNASKTIKTFNAQLEGNSGNIIRYMKPSE
jgi:prepilin-type N-terminal cleavage/methylation domain-containing protein